MGRYLLDWRLARDPKAIRDSLDNAFKDLTMHQLGLLAGVQESLSAVLKRLDPKSVEQEAKEKGGAGLFASMEKRAWKRYSDVFHEIFAENSKLFNELIYPNVRKGYLALHDNQEKENHWGAGNKPVHRTSEGKYEAKASITLYDYEVQAIQDGAVIEQVFNVGDSRSYGLEGVIAYRPTRQLTMSLSGGYLNAKWKNGSFVSDDTGSPVEVEAYSPTAGLALQLVGSGRVRPVR